MVFISLCKVLPVLSILCKVYFVQAIMFWSGLTQIKMDSSMEKSLMEEKAWCPQILLRG